MDTFAFRRIANEGGSAIVSDYGAQVLRWAPAGQPDVVWAPTSAYARPGAALTGGVPIVFPWFGPGFAHGRQTAKPVGHGFARMRHWRIDPETFTDSHVRYTLDPGMLEPGDLPWLDDQPAPRFLATYEVRVGRELSMTLTVANDGDAPFSYEAALHTYLHVGDVSGARLAGLQGADYLDATREGFPACVESAPAVTFDGTVDRVYYAHAPLELHDDALGRTIRIDAAGTAQTVVWNPGKPYGVAINARESEGWRRFVCVEAAACRDRAVTLGPGESHAITQSLSVEAGGSGDTAA